MSVENDFQEAIRAIKNSNLKLSNEELSKLYGLYKQSLFGDNTSPEPGFLNFKDKQKWKAWNEYKGRPTDMAKIAYTNFVKNLLRHDK